MADTQMVDITHELLVIEKEPEGHKVKSAIHDALYKLNQAKSVEPSPGPSPEPPSGHYVPVGIPGFVCSGVFGGFAGSIDIPSRAFIRATGEQGIDCLFTPSSTNVRYELNFADYVVPQSSWSTIYGGYNYSNQAQPGVLAGHGGQYGGNMVLGVGSDNSFMLTSAGMPKNGYHSYTISIDGNNVTVDIDDSVHLSGTYTGTIECPVGLCCGVKYQNGTKSIFEKANVKVYRFKIYQNDTLIRDFVPALGNNDRAAFYDNVSQTYFYSETGTDFIYVPEETEV